MKEKESRPNGKGNSNENYDVCGTRSNTRDEYIAMLQAELDELKGSQGIGSSSQRVNPKENPRSRKNRSPTAEKVCKSFPIPFYKGDNNYCRMCVK